MTRWIVLDSTGNDSAWWLWRIVLHTWPPSAPAQHLRRTTSPESPRRRMVVVASGTAWHLDFTVCRRCRNQSSNWFSHLTMDRYRAVGTLHDDRLAVISGWSMGAEWGNPPEGWQNVLPDNCGASNHIKISSGRGFDPDHTGSAYAAPQTL